MLLVPRESWFGNWTDSLNISICPGMSGKLFGCPGFLVSIRKPFPWLSSWAYQEPRRVSSMYKNAWMRVAVCMPSVHLLSYVLQIAPSKSQRGVGALIKKIIKMTLIMPFPPSGDIFGWKSGLAHDGRNNWLARVGKIPGRIMDYEIKGNWGKQIQGFIQKGG